MRELTITELKPLFEEFGLGPNFQGLTLIREIARLRAERDMLREQRDHWVLEAHKLADTLIPQP